MLGVFGTLALVSALQQQALEPEQQQKEGCLEISELEEAHSVMPAEVRLHLQPSLRKQHKT